MHLLPLGADTIESLNKYSYLDSAFKLSDILRTVTLSLGNSSVIGSVTLSSCSLNSGATSLRKRSKKSAQKF